jgi:competence protein ComEC
MADRFVCDKTTRLYTTPDGAEFDHVLIYGDRVVLTERERNGRTEVMFRGRRGWLTTRDLNDTHPLEAYFIDVGQGDACFILTPGGKTILVDGGSGNEAFQFLVWMYRLDLPNAVPVDIDLLVLTHADDDHIAGLISIIRHPLIKVKDIIHSGIARYRPNIYRTVLGDVLPAGNSQVLVTRHASASQLAPQELEQTMASWREAIRNEPGVTDRAVTTRTGRLNFPDPDITLTVLAPYEVAAGGATGLPWFGTTSETINGNSVVLRLDVGRVRILLPGDINSAAERFLLSQGGGNEFSSHVFKAPHHGSPDFEPSFLDAVRPQLTVVSSGEMPDHGHPRENFLGYVGRASRSQEPLLFSTSQAALFVPDPDAQGPEADMDPDPANGAMLGQARLRFKKRLNGLINIRTDGNLLFSARRVSAPYQFVSFGPIVPVP